MLAAGLKGIKKGYEIAPEASDNIFEMTDEEREAAGIGSLPADLYEAIKIAEKSALLRESLGDHVYDYLLRNKKAEWDAYKAQVTEFELNKYLSTL
jgi:glutamine synthetase